MSTHARAGRKRRRNAAINTTVVLLRPERSESRVSHTDACGALVAQWLEQQLIPDTARVRLCGTKQYLGYHVPLQTAWSELIEYGDESTIRFEVTLVGEQSPDTPLSEQVPFEIGTAFAFYRDCTPFPPPGVCLWSVTEEETDEEAADKGMINMTTLGYFEPMENADGSTASELRASRLFPGISVAEADFHESDNRYRNIVIVTYRRPGAEPKRHAFNTCALYRALVNDRRCADPIIRQPWTRDNVNLLRQLALEPRSAPLYEIEGPQFCVNVNGGERDGEEEEGATTTVDLAAVASMEDFVRFLTAHQGGVRAHSFLVPASILSAVLSVGSESDNASAGVGSGVGTRDSGE